MTEVKQKSISLLFQSDVSISYMLVVSTDFENGFAKTMQKVADLREKTEAAKRIASAMYSIPDLDAGGCFDSDTLYCKEKGRLYTWENALKVCPEGWHLPDSSEYNALIDFVEKNNNGLPTKKSLTSGTFNIFGFSIILGSGYVVRGEYSNEGGGNGNSYFWTASETDGLDSSRPPETFARARGIRTSSNALVKLSWEKIHALAVRCIQN